MGEYPSESSLMVNATQQQLSRGDFQAGLAFVPTQHEEATGGYDIAFESATRLELQYKAVYNEIDKRTFKPNTRQTAAKFPFNGEQAQTLLGRLPHGGLALYALPVVTDLSGLGDVLGSTVFIDVAAFSTLPKLPENFDEYTAFWVPKRNSNPTFSGVYLKDKNEPRYSKPEAYDEIDGRFVYTWWELKQLVQAGAAGVPIRRSGREAPTASYQQLLRFESNLASSRFPKSMFDQPDAFVDQDYETLDSVVGAVARTLSELRDLIAANRPTWDDVSQLDGEVTEDHEYLLDADWEPENQRQAIRAALTLTPDEDTEDGEDEPQSPDYAGLDPRQGSQYRQYRYLTWGDEVDTETVTIGFG